MGANLRGETELSFIDHLETAFRHDPTSVPVDQEPEERVQPLMTNFSKDQTDKSVIAIGLVVFVRNDSNEVTRFH